MARAPLIAGALLGCSLDGEGLQGPKGSLRDGGGTEVSAPGPNGDASPAPAPDGGTVPPVDAPQAGGPGAGEGAGAPGTAGRGGSAGSSGPAGASGSAGTGGTTGGGGGTVAGASGGAPGLAGSGGTPATGGTPGAAGTSGAGGTPSSGPSCTTFQGEYCSTIPSLAQPVRLDGVVDCGLPVTTFEPGAGSPPVFAGKKTSFAVAYRPEGLYLFVDVTTPTRQPFARGPDYYCGDAVELFVDSDGAFQSPPAYDNPGTMQMVIQAPSLFQTDNSTAWLWRDGIALGSWNGEFRAFVRPGGYVVEALIRAADLGVPSWSPQAASRVGFNISIDVPSPLGLPADCPRAGYYALRLAADGPCLEPYCNVRSFCTPVLR